MSNYQTNQLGLLACLRKVWFPTLLGGYLSRCTFLYLYVICAFYTYIYIYFYILYKVSYVLKFLTIFFRTWFGCGVSLLLTSTFYLTTYRDYWTYLHLELMRSWRVHSFRTNSNLNTWHVYLQSVPPDSCAKIMWCLVQSWRYSTESRNHDPVIFLVASQCSELLQFSKRYGYAYQYAGICFDIHHFVEVTGYLPPYVLQGFEGQDL